MILVNTEKTNGIHAVQEQSWRTYNWLGFPWVEITAEQYSVMAGYNFMCDIEVTDGVVTSITAGVQPEPDGEVIKIERIADIKASCEQTIVNGFDADVLGRDTLHYTLSSVQQRDLDIQYKAVTGGAQAALWHDTTRVTHELYTAEQFLNLYKIGFTFMVNCKIKSDFLEEYVISLITADDIGTAKGVTWETELPEEYQTQVDTQVAMLLSVFGSGATADTGSNTVTEPVEETVTTPVTEEVAE